MTTRQLLLDADGVLQVFSGGWPDAFAPYVGERAAEFAERLLELEAPALAGREHFLPMLGGLLVEFGVTADPAAVHDDIWLRIEVDAEVLALVRELRAGGVRVHLASNQRAERAEVMVHQLGFAHEFDGLFLSHALGVVKPDAAFFRAIVADLGTAPGDLVLVDDNPANIAAAASLGLRTVHWSVHEDRATLRRRLGENGFPV